MKRKSIIFALSLLVASGISVAQVLNKNKKSKETIYKTVPEDIAQNLPQVKSETKKEMEPFRYEGSKVTYFIYKTFEQRKEVELFFFSNNEYRVIFNSKLIDGDDPIKITIYDQPRNIAGRHVLYSETLSKDGSNKTITSTELLETLKSKLPEVDEFGNPIKVALQKVYIDYVIPSKEQQIEEGEKGERVVIRTKGAIVMAMGYNNV